MLKITEESMENKEKPTNTGDSEDFALIEKYAA